MARVSVQLLGRPCVFLDGVEAPAPKGAKPWGLLAYLATSERAHLRSELAELLFSEAVDPLGALRWNLAALRRLLDRPDALKGDQIRLDRTDIAVDLGRVDERDPEVVLHGSIGRELLAGLRFPDSPMFELWLAGERQRCHRRATSLMREVSLDAFARGDTELAIRLSDELVTADPFDEGHHALRIRTLALSGEHDAAREHFDRCAALLRSELNVEPGPAVLAAMHLVTHPSGAATESTFDEICARINVAWQSFLGGSIDHGLDMGRSSVLLSDMSGDAELRAASRIYLAGMLSMSVRGWDEAATVTSEARHLAIETGRTDHLALSHSVTAGSELMRGDYRIALEHAEAGAAYTDDAGALALNLAFLGAIESDTGLSEQARVHARAATDAAENSRDAVQLAYAYAYAAHVELDARRYAVARPHAERAVAACAQILVMQPWPMAMLAEIEVHEGNLAGAVETATRADGLALATGMSYQRALAQRAIALAEAAAGDDEAALDRLIVALGHARRTTGQGYPFHWPVAWVLESLACISMRSRSDDAARWAEALRDHANATGMVTFAARADELLGMELAAP